MRPKSKISTLDIETKNLMKHQQRSDKEGLAYSRAKSEWLNGKAPKEQQKISHRQEQLQLQVLLFDAEVPSVA